MKQLRIVFKSPDLDEYSWCALDGSTILEKGDSTQSEHSQYYSLADDVILVVPQQCVYETSIDVANKKAKQLLSAAAFQLEDQMAEDVDKLHFAQGEEVNGVVPFVVIKHDLMQKIAEFEKSNGFVSAAVISEINLCQQPNKEEINVYHYNGHILVRGADSSQNAVCDVSQKSFYLEHFYAQNSGLKINEIEESDYDFLSAPLDLENCVNLKQKEYSQNTHWLPAVKAYGLPISLTILLCVIFVFNQWHINTQLMLQKSAIEKQQQQIVSASLNNYSTKDNPKRALIKALQRQQSASTELSFISLFHKFLKVKKSVKGIELKKINYKNKALTVDITAANLQLLDKLITALKQNNFNVSVTQMDAVDNESRGRFILRYR